MSQQKKKMLRRKIAATFRYQLQSIENLLVLRDTFGKFHDDYAIAWELMAQNCQITAEMIKDVAIKAYGYFPDDISKWSH